MENSIFKFIWRYSKRQQMTIMVMTAFSLPFLYLVLDLPKYIINDAIDGKTFPKELFGFEFGQIEYLLVLCAALLVLLIINAMFSMSINTYKGVSSERLIRRLRYQLYENILRFPPRHFQKVTPPEISSMITAEVEPMGNFISDSYSMPMVQGGTMLTILFFMFVEDPILALVAVSMVPVQAWLIPKLQVKVNLLGRERVLKARKLAGWVGESVLGVRDIHTNDASKYMQATLSAKLGHIFNIRYQLYQKKFFMKALNVFLSQLTPLFFYSIGGILTINGDLSLGALVAVLAAKIAVTAVSIGFGFGGGVFSPSLVIGALLGSAYGMMATSIFPALSSGPEAYAIVGMGGVTAAVLGAPISTILIVFEMTGNYKLTIAVMVAVVISSMITRGFHGGSFFLWQLERLGVDIKGGFETALLRGINMRRVMTRMDERVSLGAALQDLRNMLQESETGILFVVRDDGVLYGTITLAGLGEAAFEHQFDDLIKAGDVARTRPSTLAVDDDLEAAMKMMRESGEHHIAVVEDRDSMLFIGCVHERDVMAAYNKALVEARREERDG